MEQETNRIKFPEPNLSEEEIREAITHFRQVVMKDPEFRKHRAMVKEMLVKQLPLPLNLNN